jgi:hypothetical protein
MVKAAQTLPTSQQHLPQIAPKPASAAALPQPPGIVRDIQASKEQEQRGQLLSSNKELRSLHEQLVKNGIISDEESWESRKVERIEVIVIETFSCRSLSKMNSQKLAIKQLD